MSYEQMSSFVLTTTSFNFFTKEDKLHYVFEKEVPWLRINVELTKN